MKPNKTKYFIALGNLLFFIALLVFWRFFYVNHLLQKEQLQLFMLGSDYLWKHLSFQGGLAVYISEFICQFFLNPWIAAASVSFLLFLFAFFIQKIIQKTSTSLFFPLAYLPALGYSFLLLNVYYPLSGLLAVLLACGAILFYLKIKNFSLRFGIGILLILLTYWFAGGAYILFTLTIIIAEIQHKTTKNKNATPNIFSLTITYFLVALIFPFLCKQFFLVDNLQETYLSRDFYKISLLFPTQLILILISVPILFFYYNFIQEKIRGIGRILPNIAFSLIVVASFTGFYFLPNWEEEKEMHFDNLVANQQWNEIISLAEKTPPSGRQGRLALSLALAKTGQMSEKLFSFNPQPNDFFIPFDLKGMAPLIANEPYFYLGLINFSKMLCDESIESTPDEKMPVRAVKRFAEDCIITGQYKVAERYLWYLEKTIFYRKWAKNARQYLFNDDKVASHPVWGKLRKQQPKDDFYYQYDKPDLALVTLLRSDPQNKTAYEYLMGWYLLQKDFNKFLKYLPLLKTVGYNDVPKTYQEAVAYIKTLLKEEQTGLEQIPIDPQNQQKLVLYARAFQQGGSKKPEEMKKQFGDTYWYYLHFTKLENE